MQRRLITLVMAVACLMPLTGQATAIKNCFASPVTYEAVYNHEVSAADNNSNTTFSVTYLAGSGSDQEANCECTGGVGASTTVTELTAVGSPLSPGAEGRGHLTDRLDVAVSGYTDAILNGSSLTLIPIDSYPSSLDSMESRYDLKNTEKVASVCSDDTRPSGGSPNKRKFRWNTVSLSFHITRPIFGKESFNSVIVAQYYACLFYSSACTQSDLEHVSDVRVTGEITAPLSCTLGEGGIIDVDLGNITTPQFIAKGQNPTGYTLRDVDISYHCDDPDAKGTADKITLTLIADQGVAEGSSGLIAKMIGRDDLGVRIYDENNVNVILDGTMTFPVVLDPDGNGRIKMKAAPVSTTNARPAAGKFEGNVTVKMDIK